MMLVNARTGRAAWVFVRKPRTASGAAAVQIAHRAGGRKVVDQHRGSADTDTGQQVLGSVRILIGRWRAHLAQEQALP